MSNVNIQTVKLAKGRHASPEEGVCVMELASMLAGEEFSDRPRSVSPAIAGFLRSYNDLLDGRRRQDLYGLAAEVIGTAGDPAVELARADRLRAWGEQRQLASRWRRFTSIRSRRVMAGRRLRPHEAGPFAVRTIGRVGDELHLEVLALVGELAAMQAEHPMLGVEAPTLGSAPAAWCERAPHAAGAEAETPC